MEQFNPFGFHSEETDLDGNLMSWLWQEETRNANNPSTLELNFPEQTDFGYPMAATDDGQYYYEGFGAPPVFLPPLQCSNPTTGVSRRGLDDDVLSPTAPIDGLVSSPAVALREQDHVTDLLSNSQTRPIPSTATPAQAKNRRAQKKFREKQKAKMLGLSEEVELLRKRVQDLSVENKDLENSNMLLGKVVKMRDRQMSTLKHKHESLMNPKEPSSWGSQKVITSGDEVLSMERSSIVDEHLTANFPLSKFADVNNDVMKEVWKKYVDRLSELLIDNDLCPNNPGIMEQIHISVGELGEICMKYATLYPSGMCNLVSNVELLPQMRYRSDEAHLFWKNVLNSLDLTLQQERQILTLRTRFVSHLESIWKERTQLSGQLQSCVDEKTEAFGSNSMSCKLGKTVREAIENLKDTIFTDGQHHTDFIASFFQLVLKDIQTARVFVQSYPYYPDVLMLANLVHEKYQTGASVSQTNSCSSNSDFPTPISTQSSSM
eukprot:g8407.t1